MDPDLRQALEAILFVVDEPVDVTTLSQVLEVGRVEVEEALSDLARELEDGGRGFVVRNVAGGWRMYTAAAADPYVERWVLSGRSRRLSHAALETLAVVAYKQPVSRQEVSDIRGVNADAALRTLLAHGLVDEVGRDPGPGQAILYGTTTQFLERVGAASIDDLPSLTDFLPDGPAPDEPHDHGAARARIRSGEQLDPRPDGRDPARPSVEKEIEDLSDALERVARNAMTTLESAVRAAAEEDAEEEDGPP
jgi:segregation and condensation protein B